MTKKQMALHLLAGVLDERGKPLAARFARHVASDPVEASRQHSVLSLQDYTRGQMQQLKKGPSYTITPGLTGSGHHVNLAVQVGDHVHSFGGFFSPEHAAALLGGFAREGAVPQDGHALGGRAMRMAESGRDLDPPPLKDYQPTADEPDWRPNSAIPEDFYGYSRKRKYAKPAWWPNTGWGGRPGKEPITHEKVNAWLGKKNEKQLSNNRKVWRDHTGDIHLRLHYTNIVTWHPDGSYTLNTGGWHSPTTARNMAAVIGLPVSRVNKRGQPPQLGVQGKPIVDGAKWEPVMPPAPEQDWRPNETIPEDYYALSRRGGRRKYAQKKPRTADFLTAVRVLRGSGQKRLHAVAEDIARGLGLSPAKTRDALLDGPRGAIPGVAQAVAGADPHTARYAAAWYGLLARTPSLGLFHVRPDGPDSLYKFHVRGSAHTARRVLDRHGIAARVLLPHGAGYDVVVPDPGRRLRANAVKAAGHLGGRIEESVGHLEPLGHADPAQARTTFRKIVERYEGGRR